MVLASCLTSAQVGFAQQPTAAQPYYFIREYRVSGSELVSGEDISKAVYPFLGPGRTAEDIEQARVALEDVRALRAGRLAVAANELTCLYLLPVLDQIRSVAVTR